MRFGFRCPNCAEEYPGHVRRWRCECGAHFALEDSLPFSREAIDTDIPGLWRYRALPPVNEIISLGEGGTPLVEVELYGQKVACKLEYLAPTGSFKDRGTSVLVSALVEMGIERLVEDSSGNPAASHYSNPLPPEGIKTEAYKICEDLGWRAPENLILPVAQGTHLLSLYPHFRHLLEPKLIKKIPRPYGVEAIGCAPLYEAFHQRAPTQSQPTLAEAISIREPIRGREVLEAVRATEGGMLAVTDEETLQARDILARQGLYVEPTSAVAVAALKQLSPGGVTVIPLTGSGLKSPKE